jgi:hypothetical protein
MEKNNSNLKYKQGDIIIVSSFDGKCLEVNRVTGYCNHEYYDYNLLESRDEEYHPGVCMEKDVVGLYAGTLDIKGNVWHPKYNIGDTVLVNLKYFGDKPTWHTIYNIEYYYNKDNTYRPKEKLYNICGYYSATEEDVLDVIRYGETVTTTESKK